MNIQTFFTLYILALPIFIVIDFLWLGVIAKSLYKNQIGHLLGDVNWFAAFIFYGIFVLGLTFFVLYPAATRGTLATALVLGGLFGFFAYATYDLTNLSILKSWPVTITIVDIVWGTILGATVSVATVFLFTLMK